MQAATPPWMRSPVENVMTSLHQVSTSDLDVGRILAGLTRADLARAAQLGPEVVRNATVMHKHRRASPAITESLVRVLELRGIIFESQGIVRHVDGRMAPTRKAVGILRGRRLVRARNALGMSPVEVAMEAGVSIGALKRLEAQHQVKQARSAYAVVGTLQLEGYQFGPNHGDRVAPSGRRRKLQPWEKDLPVEWLGVGLHVNVQDWFDE